MYVETKQILGCLWCFISNKYGFKIFRKWWMQFIM